MSNNKYKILLVEDDRSISEFLETILQTNGYQVLQSGTCRHGILMFSSHLPDLILLDLGLPDRDGLELIRHVRERSMVPIIVLSSRWEVQDKVSALDLGANDYITKPFGSGELMARIRAALRSSWTASTLGRRYTVADLTIDYDARKVTVGAQEIRLTQTEYNILAFLAQHSGKVLTYSIIIHQIWGDQDPGSIKKLQVNMVNIRRKMGSKPGENRYIINELGVGYRMAEDE